MPYGFANTLRDSSPNASFIGLTPSLPPLGRASTNAAHCLSRPLRPARRHDEPDGVVVDDLGVAEQLQKALVTSSESGECALRFRFRVEAAARPPFWGQPLRRVTVLPISDSMPKPTLALEPS